MLAISPCGMRSDNADRINLRRRVSAIEPIAAIVLSKGVSRLHHQPAALRALAHTERHMWIRSSRRRICVVEAGAGLGEGTWSIEVILTRVRGVRKWLGVRGDCRRGHKVEYGYRKRQSLRRMYSHRREIEVEWSVRLLCATLSLFARRQERRRCFS